MAALLMDKEKDPLIPHFFMMLKMLCHRFGLNYSFKTKSGHTVLLEGFDEEYTYPELCRSLDAFIKDFKSCSDPETREVWIQAREILSKALRNRENVEIALVDNLTVFPVRFSDFSETRGHSTGLVILQKENLFIKCNRGDGCGDTAGLQVLDIGKPERLGTILQELLRKRYDLDGKMYFNDGLKNELSLVEVEYMQHKQQQGGTCTWASAKLNLRAVLYFLLRAKFNDDQKAKEYSRELYKKWSQFDRIMAIKEFCEAVTQIENVIKSKGLEELSEEGIVHEDFLKLVIPKCERESLVECLHLLKKKFPDNPLVLYAIIPNK